MRPDLVKHLIAQGEGPRLEFKRALDLSSKGGQAEFAKDLMSLVNVSDVLGKRGYLLVGIDDDGSVMGLQTSLSRQRLREAADHYCQPPVIFTYNETLVDGRLVGVITVPRSYHKPHKFKRGYGPDEKGRSIAEHTVFTRHLSHVVTASPEEVVALDREAELLRRKRAWRLAVSLLACFLCLLLITCSGGVSALRNPAVQEAVTRFLPEGIPLLASGVNPDAAPLRQRDVEVALEKLAALPSFRFHHVYIAALNGREDKAAETIITACGADYHLYRTANFGFLPWNADREEEYRIGDRVYVYEGGVKPENWRVGPAAGVLGSVREVMRVAQNSEAGLLGDAVWGETGDADNRFYMLYRKGRVEDRLCDIYQARYQVQPGTVFVFSSLSPLDIPTSGQAEEEAWIDQETGALLRYTGRLAFVDENGVEWEITVALRVKDIDQSCPVVLQIPGDAMIEE